MEESSKCVLLQLKLDNANKYSLFNLDKAVCNYGFFMMAPNSWCPLKKCLKRPLRIADNSTSLLVTITQPQTQSCDYLLVKVHGVGSLCVADKGAILDGVTRMLRLSSKDGKDIENFHQVNPEAKQKGFGRLFRSPTLFEDIIKSILLSNCQWQRTLEMAQALCLLQHKLANGLLTNVSAKPSKKQMTEYLGNFPTAAELADFTEDSLRIHCNLGYRARIILNIARKVVSKKLDLERFEVEESSKVLFSALTELKGIGPFIGATIMMCIGFYDRIPIDSETTRHLHQIHGIGLQKSICKRKLFETSSERNLPNLEKMTKKSWDIHMKRIYDKYAPFQCLAFWMELLHYYESKVGKLSELSYSDYRLVTGTAHT